jgi:hypothetical protein
MTMRPLNPLTHALACACLAAACTETATPAPAPPDARHDASDDGDGRDGDTRPPEPAIVWNGSPPPVAGDGRVVDVGDTLNGHGWDFCSDHLEVASPGALPPPTRGQGYLVSNNRSTNGGGTNLVQAYFFRELDPHDFGAVAGLWFDLALVSGTATNATVTFYETDLYCVDKRVLGTFAVSPALSATGHWKTGCIDLADRGNLTAVGIRLNAPSGVLGFDALRFDKPCH